MSCKKRRREVSVLSILLELSYTTILIRDGTRMKCKEKVTLNAAYICKKLTITIITGSPYTLDLQ